MADNTKNPVYQIGYNNGYEMGANIETRNIKQAMERMRDDLEWALDLLEKQNKSLDVLDRIAYLRYQYGLKHNA